MTRETQRELEHLLASLCDGCLTDDQHARLEELLSSDTECRLAYFQYLDLHATLLQKPLEHEQPSPPPADRFLVETLVGPVSGVDLNRKPKLVPESSGPKRRVPQLVRYALVSAATLAASLLVQTLLQPPSAAIKPLTGNSRQNGAPLPSVYVATLVQSAHCAWEPGAPWRTGSRLAAGRMRLQKGVARVRFDTGSEILMEGPADVRLDSENAATILHGKVVFRTDATATHFDLNTPSSTLVDFGMEYAVSVNIDEEEVHVFDGEVERVPRLGSDATPERVKAGEARRSRRLEAFPSESIHFDPKRFVREVPQTKAPEPMTDIGLVAYEGFDYRDPRAMRSGTATGGYGWLSPWVVNGSMGPMGGPLERAILNVDESLDRPNAALSSVGGSFDASGFVSCFRRLGLSLRLDVDGVYYVSFLVRRPQAHPMSVVGITLKPHEDPRQRPDSMQRLVLGVNGSNEVYARLGKFGTRASLPLTGGATYLLIAKIVASRLSADQVYLRIYGPRETIETMEPASWTVVTPPFQSELAFDWLGVSINSKNRQVLDEIRVGTTWTSVTAPWLTLKGN